MLDTLHMLAILYVLWHSDRWHAAYRPFGDDNPRNFLVRREPTSAELRAASMRQAKELRFEVGLRSSKPERFVRQAVRFCTDVLPFRLYADERG